MKFKTKVSSLSGFTIEFELDPLKVIELIVNQNRGFMGLDIKTRTITIYGDNPNKIADELITALTVSQ